MKRLSRLPIMMLPLVALIIPMVPTAASAQTKSYYHAGAWDAFSGKTANGGAVCGIATSGLSDNRGLAISFDIGGAATVFSASKPNWTIPDDTHVTVIMQIGLNTPWTIQGTGRGHRIEWKLDQGVIQTFDQQFRSAPSMTVTFPEGNEPPWTVSLTGSTAISDTFARCVHDLTRQVQSSPSPAPSSSAPAPATQPFNQPPSNPPAH